MRPEDMNTINPNGKAFNGDRGPVALACAILVIAAICVVVGAISAL